MQIDHGRFQLAMSHISLDDPQVNTGFKQMGGIRMPEGVNGDHFFVDSGSKHGSPKGPLDAAFGHGGLSRLGPISASADGWKKESRMTVGDPIATKQAK